MRFARPIGVERRHFQRLVNKVGTAILTLNAAFSTAHEQGGHTSPRLVSERRARLSPANLHRLTPGRESATTRSPHSKSRPQIHAKSQKSNRAFR
jgi:hypothetical protein